MKTNGTELLAATPNSNSASTLNHVTPRASSATVVTRYRFLQRDDADVAARSARDVAIAQTVVDRIRSLPGVEAVAVGPSPLGIDQESSLIQRQPVEVNGLKREHHSGMATGWRRLSGSDGNSSARGRARALPRACGYAIDGQGTLGRRVPHWKAVQQWLRNNGVRRRRFRLWFYSTGSPRGGPVFRWPGRSPDAHELRRAPASGPKPRSQDFEESLVQTLERIPISCSRPVSFRVSPDRDHSKTAGKKSG